MPSDEYASAGAGGALRLKGAKVEKHKSKKHKKKSREGREKRAKRAEEEHDKRGEREEDAGASGSDDGKKKTRHESDDDAELDPYARMTAAERRFAEAQDQKIRDLMHATPEEARAARPDLFKSHKERLADLNTYLSRMSEHNDMPKIGPG